MTDDWKSISDLSDTIAEEIIDETSNERENLHKYDPSGRQLTKQTHRIGLLGEFAFAKLVGIFPDISKKRNGDMGIDFEIPLLATVDVKTRNERDGGLNDTLMLVEHNKLNADIYVLAINPSDGGACECVGWMRKENVVRYPLKDLGTGVLNHQIPATDLHPMEPLISRVARFKK